MKFFRGLIEYEIKCKWCPSKDFTHIPTHAHYKCDGCGRKYDSTSILKSATVYATDLDGKQKKLN